MSCPDCANLPEGFLCERCAGAEHAIQKAERRKKVKPEYDIQRRCFKWFGANYPHLKPLLVWIKNEFKADKIAGAVAKSRGWRPGFPDVGLFVASGPFHGLFIELKAPKGRAPSADQKRYHRLLRGQGYHVAVIRSLDEFINLITTYIR